MVAEIQNDEDLRAGAVDLWISAKSGSLDNGKSGYEVMQLLCVTIDEHCAREEALPGGSCDHTDRQRVAGIGAHNPVLHKEVPTRQVREHSRAKPVVSI